MFVSEESLNRITKDSIQCNSRFEYLCLDPTNPAKVLQIFQMLNCDVKCAVIVKLTPILSLTN